MISVIVPAYNAEKYLAECLTSILGQSYRNIEVLLINDGSTDSTLAIATDFAGRDARLKIFTTENRGLSSARNFGIEKSSGEWITFVDSDDCLFPEALSIMSETVKSTLCEIVVAQIRRDIVSKRFWEKHFAPFVLNPRIAINRTLYQDGMLPSVCGKLFHKSIFADARFLSSTWYEDLDIFYRLYEKSGKIVVIPDVVYFYRRNPESFINTFSTSRLDVLTVTERIENYMESHHPELVPAARDRRLSANFNILALLERQKNAEYEDVKAQCWDLICRYRRQSLVNPEVRLKNKFGIIVSFFGRKVFRLVARFM